MRSIIVEGCDNSGKTTLIKRLEETFGMEVVLSCRSIPLLEQIEWVQSQVERKVPVIYDRFTLISEEVYGPILRGGSKFEGLASYHTTWGEIVKNVIESMLPLIIYCRPPEWTIVKSIHEREQMDGVSTHLNQLISRYDLTINNIVSLTDVRLFEYDWTKDRSGSDMVQRICREDVYFREAKYEQTKKLLGV